MQEVEDGPRQPSPSLEASSSPALAPQGEEDATSSASGFDEASTVLASEGDSAARGGTEGLGRGGIAGLAVAGVVVVLAAVVAALARLHYKRQQRRPLAGVFAKEQVRWHLCRLLEFRDIVLVRLRCVCFNNN